MSSAENAKIPLAAAATVEEIAHFLHDPSPRVVRTLLGNANLSEDDVLIIARRKNLPADIFEIIARDKRWSDSYPVRLTLANNPRTPLSISLTIADYLRLFDLVDLTRSHFIPLAFRNNVERIIIERVPTMPLGNKKTLAKKAGGAVLLTLLRDDDPEVVSYCLNNPHLTEAHLFKAITRADTAEGTIRLIAEHGTWSNRSLIRFSLVRNTRTPLPLSVRFLRTMKIMDLRELYADASVPATVKPFIHRELRDRGADARLPEVRVYEIDDEEMAAIEAENFLEQRFEEIEPEDEDSAAS